MPLFGNSIDETTAKQLAQNFWKENNIMGVRGDKVFKKRMDDARFVNVAPQCGYSEFFIFNNEDGKGFVIIAAEDCVTPILGYSYDNNFVADSLPSNLKGWLDGYAEQIRIAVDMKATASDEIRADWECLRLGKNLPIRSENSVSPLINTSWGQGDYYNAQCPGLLGFHTPTGCVATAMAQIMKYWNYPTHGYGFHSYYCQPYGTQSANFGGTMYQWNLMPNIVTSSNNAVATLMYHCGVSVEMDYGFIHGSGAQIISYDGMYEYCAENAFKTYFGYSSSLSGLERRYNESNWIQILKNELDNARPILYGGSGPGGGHAFVCDGYNNTNYFHFNWGWCGESNGYYNVNNLNPSNGGQIENYNSFQHALVGIQPDSDLQNYDLVLYDDVQMVGDYFGNYEFGQTISSYAEILNNGNSTFTGYIAAAVFDDDGYFIDFLGGGSATIEPNYWTGGTVEHDGGIPFLPSYDYLYHTVMFYSTDGSYWSIVRSGNYINDAVFQVFNLGQEIVTNSEFTISTGEDVFYTGQTATVNVDIINEGTETYYGMVWTALLDEEGYYVQIIDTYDIDEGLPVNYHYTNGINFTNTITAPEGQYYLGLLYIDAQNSAHYAGSEYYPCLKRVYVINSTMEEDPYEPNNTVDNAFMFNGNFSNNVTTINTTGSSLHNGSDVDYYRIDLVPGYDYTITPRLHDSYNSGNSYTYSVDAMFAYSIDGISWSDFYDDVMGGDITIENGGTVYFDVLSYYEGNIGTYLLSIDITRSQHSGNSHSVSVFVNPDNAGTVTGAGEYNHGSSCTLNATANTGYTFFQWNDGVTTNPRTITVTQDTAFVAFFRDASSQGTGGFSVNTTTKVTISPGNLQYQASTGTWRFAEHQYDVIGEGNSNIGANYAGWIDLFGWGTSGWNCGNTYYQPYDKETGNNAYYYYGPLGNYSLTGNYVNSDWGVYNAISNGGNQLGIWRTLTSTEFNYLINGRTNASSKRSRATVNDIHGLVLLPDTWILPTGINFTNNASDWSTNTYSISQWQQMENNGAVFLPAAGNRDYTSVGLFNNRGSYWSSDSWNGYGALALRLDLSTLDVYDHNYFRCAGLAVRLVKNYEEYTIWGQASPNQGGSVSGCGIYESGAICTLTATPNTDYTFPDFDSF